MADITLKVTAAGIAEHARVLALGQALNLSYARFGVGQYTPSGAETDLMTPFGIDKKFNNAVTGHSAGEVQYAVFEDSNDVYNVGEVGIFTNNDVLFAIGSRVAAEGWILVKGVNPLSFIDRFIITGIDNPNITFETPTWPATLATEDFAGLVKYSERGNQTDTDAVTRTADIPEAIPTATETVRGLVNLANKVEAVAGVNNAKPVTPIRLKDYVDSRIGAVEGKLAELEADGVFAPARIPGIDASKIISGELNSALFPADVGGKIEVGDVPNLPAGKITSGTFSSARIPGIFASKIIAGVFAVERIPNLPASKITTGILNSARIGGLNASKITAGTLAVDRIPGIPASRVTSGIFPRTRIPEFQPPVFSSLPTSGNFNGRFGLLLEGSASARTFRFVVYSSERGGWLRLSVFRSDITFREVQN